MLDRELLSGIGSAGPAFLAARATLLHQLHAGVQDTKCG
jgi:hypothetical protein